MPSSLLERVPNLPARLKELRKEVGWTLENVAEIVGVTQRGVVSNWEAVNQRHRVPDMGNLLTLQKWYGVSMDYLLGHPGAERDSPMVKIAKREVMDHLRTLHLPMRTTPSDRARLLMRIARKVGPDVFFNERIALLLMISEGDLQRFMDLDIACPNTWLDRLSVLVGVPVEWFFTEEPQRVLAEPT